MACTAVGIISCHPCICWVFHFREQRKKSPQPLLKFHTHSCWVDTTLVFSFMLTFIKWLIYSGWSLEGILYLIFWFQCPLGEACLCSRDLPLLLNVITLSDQVTQFYRVLSLGAVIYLCTQLSPFLLWPHCPPSIYILVILICLLPLKHFLTPHSLSFPSLTKFCLCSLCQ